MQLTNSLTLSNLTQMKMQHTKSSNEIMVMVLLFYVDIF